MKVMHIISGDLWAGAEVQVYNALVALAENKDFSLKCIVFNEGILSRKLKEYEIDTELIDEQKFSVWKIIKKLRAEIKEYHPDVLHVDMVKEHFSTTLALVKSSRKIPLVRTVHGARKSPSHLPFLKSIRSKSVVFVDNWLIGNAADAVVAVSKQLEKEFCERKVKGTVCRIYNAIKETDYQVKVNVAEIKRKYGAEGVFWIGTAARLAEPKNLAMLIKSAQYLVESGIPFKISIFGQGPLRDDLQGLVNLLSLGEYVELHGFELDIVPILRSLDVFVLCSIHEGLPMVLLEAMLMETPIVGTDVIGINEVIENGSNGLLVPLNDHKALAEALLDIYFHAEKAEQLTKNSRDVLHKQFSMENMTDKLVTLYHDIVN